jgi:hypothetical protein
MLYRTFLQTCFEKFKFQITVHPIFCRFSHGLISGVSFPVHEI